MWKYVRKSLAFKVSFALSFWNLTSKCYLLSRVPRLVQMEFKVQEVFTKEIRSKISKDSPSLHLASPSSWVCPPTWEGQWVTCRVFFFFFSSWPFPPRREDGVADRQQAGGRSPVPACMGHTSSRTPRSDPLATSSTPRGAWAPARVCRGLCPPWWWLGCSGNTSFIWFAFGVEFSFSIVFKMGEFRIESKLFGLVDGSLSVVPRQRRVFSQLGLSGTCNQSRALSNISPLITSG